MIRKEDIEKALADYFATSPLNRITAAMAIDAEDVGKRMYDAPIIEIGSADDALWEQMKSKEAVGEIFRTPKEWMPTARCVVSYFAPFSDFVIEGNKADRVKVGNGWLYARIEGQAFLTEVNHFLERWFREQGIEAFSPYASEGFRYVFEAGTNDAIENKALSFTSNWSERHVAYICGLGTFGLSKGLITERGVAGRFGSVITAAELEITPRKYSGIYDYCSMCGACATNCPAEAITLQEGKSHIKCTRYFDTLRKRYAPRYGCGKCQVKVPCERRAPNLHK